MTTLPSQYRLPAQPDSLASKTIGQGLQQLSIVPSSPLSTPTPRSVNQGIHPQDYDSPPDTPPIALESEDEEEEPLEHLNNIRGYQEMVDIIDSTMSSPETLATERRARSPNGDLVTDNGQLEEDDGYVESGVDDEMDTVDEESVAEGFEDILDYEAEMERSQPSHPSASEYV